MDSKFNVYIYNEKGEAQAQIGGNMSEDRAEKRELSGLQRIDRNNFYIASQEVGSPEDKKAQKEEYNENDGD